MKPLAIDLYCGLGGWTDGLLAEGFDVIGFDLEKHDYGTEGYPGQLVLQDVLTLHGSQFKDTTLIVGSSPCQEFSFRAMPWKAGKAVVPDVLPDWWKKSEAQMDAVERAEWEAWKRDHPKPAPVLGIALFEAQFRIQREACIAAGRHIPLVVENVRGAQKWVGRSKWHYGSFHLWGDVPALMPTTKRALKGGDRNKNRTEGHAWSNSFADTLASQIPCDDHDICLQGPCQSPYRLKEGQKSAGNEPQLWKDRQGGHFDGSYGLKLPGNNSERRWEDRPVQRLADAGKGMSGLRGMSHPTDAHPRDLGGPNDPRRFSRSNARKAASAQIAKIPFALSRHIARCFMPEPSPQL